MEKETRNWVMITELNNITEIATYIGDWRREKGFDSPTDFSQHSHINEKLMLTVSELGEACEAVRHNDFDNFKEELADAIIRILDLTDSLNIDIREEIEQKMIKNEARPHMHGKNC